MLNAKNIYLKSIRLKEERIEDKTIYPFHLPAVKHLGVLALEKPVTFFVGENGSGKSTLLEAIAVSSGFNPEGGSKNFNFKTQDSHSSLTDYLTIAKNPFPRPEDGYFLRAESFYNVATEIDELDYENTARTKLVDSYGGKSLHHQSHGESFLSFFIHRCYGRGLYLFDEPEAALSPTGQFTLLSRLHQLVVEKDSQFIIATHSPILLAYPHADILEFKENGIEKVEYNESSHVQLYKAFLSNPAILKELLRLED